MSFIPISQLTQTFSPSGTDVVPIVSAGATYKISAADLTAGSVVNCADTMFYQSGWYLNLRGSLGTSNTLTLNSLYASPLQVNRNCQIQSLSVYVASASTSGTLVAGLYGTSSVNNSKPVTLITTLGTISTSAIGFQTINFSPISLYANYGGPTYGGPPYNSGLYYIALVCEGQIATLATQQNLSFYSYTDTLNTATHLSYINTGVTSTLPATFNTGGGSSNYAYWYWLQYV